MARRFLGSYRDSTAGGLPAHSRVRPRRANGPPSQGFPSIVSSLTRQRVAPKLRDTVRTNQRMVSPGANILMLNGMLVEVHNFELYGGAG
jgi:hypothetical protein